MAKEDFPPACPEAEKLSYAADGLRTLCPRDWDAKRLSGHVEFCAQCQATVTYLIEQVLRKRVNGPEPDRRIFPESMVDPTLGVPTPRIYPSDLQKPTAAPQAPLSVQPE